MLAYSSKKLVLASCQPYVVQSIRSLSGLPPGIGDVLKNPATMAAAKKFMTDPQAMSKIQDMMKDKGTMEKMMGMMSDPAFRKQVEALRKETGMPGADQPITDELIDKYKAAMGFPGGGGGDGGGPIDAESVAIPGQSVADVAAKAATTTADAPPVTYNTAAGKPKVHYPPVIELREYQLQPYMAGQYMLATNEAANLRKSLVPLRLFSLPDTGGQLNRATHLYYYAGGMPDRDAKRSGMAINSEWQEYLQAARPCMQEQQSQLYCEAPLPAQYMTGLKSLTPALVGGPNNSDPIYEFRKYQLKLGYDSVPRFLDHFQRGLPARMACKDPSSELVSLMHTEVGAANEVIEVWRHGDGNAAMHASRMAARAAPAWKAAVAGIAELSTAFHNAIHRPAVFSNYK